MLREFPGVPEGVVDVIPVDLVVAAVIASAGADPIESGPGESRIVQVASGSTNPLRYQGLVDDVREWFTENPLYDDKGQPIIVPDWKFPGHGRVETQLGRANTVLRSAEKVVLNLPLRGKAAQWGATLKDRRSQVNHARSSNSTVPTPNAKRSTASTTWLLFATL